MARVLQWWSHSKTVALIWFVSAIVFYTLFQMALRNSNSASSGRYYAFIPSLPFGSRENFVEFDLALMNFDFADSLVSSEVRRSKLYDGMARDLDEKGAAFLKQGETSQSLSLSDIFTLKDGSVEPVLKAANPPVRANVLYLSTEYSVPISETVKRIVNPYFDKSIWFQNSSLYHFSMFHASHHITPVPATEDEIEAEVNAVRATSKTLCPLNIVLDRVVLTSTGVLLGCWQVTSGTDPVTIRAKLRTALPRAPEKQLYDAAILHTSFARLLGQPKASAMDSHNSDLVQFFHELVARLNMELRGFRAVVSELWYVEEYDVLALALNGRMKVRRFQLGCPTN
ncbi:Transmembrane protein [Trema orientale]|uniref:Transmembrane protein n=1 Tax=Trema orientale TaxID=63057 RepID=A0A2P5F743_TREOI|nr:Transmembrane protein [Trema orientale]